MNELPIELIVKIIVYTVAQSVHTISLSPEDVAWEMDVLKTLSLVSPWFRDIALELASRTFMLPAGEKSSRIYLHVSRKLSHLRMLGQKLHKPFTPFLKFSPLDDEPLVSGYSCYLGAVDLRYNSATASSFIFKPTHDSILNCLNTAASHCRKVEPLGMGDILQNAIEDERQVTQQELAAIEATMALRDYVAFWKDLQGSADDASDVERIRMIKRIQIHEALAVVESADEFLTNTHCLTKIFKVPELSDVHSVMRELLNIEFDIDEYNIGPRVKFLVKRWMAQVRACPFLSQKHID